MADEQKPKILVVDDNPQNRALAQAALEDEGYDVITATNGEEAIEAFEKGPPGCLLLDVRMPKMDGFETCARIRALPGGADVPIVFLTALRDVDTFDAAIRAGADDFLMKPIRPTELVVRVQAALKLGRMSSELREHYELVRRQRDELIRLQLQKEQLTAYVVHDLKNPVNSIDLYAQLLVRNRELPESLRSSVQQIRDEVRSLMRLILNLLDINRSEEGRLVPNVTRLDLDGVFREAREALEMRARTKQVELRIASDVTELEADADLLRRVLENLLDNAIRYAPESSAVRITARRDDEAIEIRVADSGAGVPPELAERVFQRYVQLEKGGAAAARSGRGLGLTFCRLVVEAHGGRIWLEQGAPGAIFCLRIPGEAKKHGGL
jgi:signal transduction histidine kinase